MRNYTATNYPPHTLAPDPHQGELKLQPPRQPCPTRRLFADVCPRCRCLHTSQADLAACRAGAREQK